MNDLILKTKSMIIIMALQNFFVFLCTTGAKVCTTGWINIFFTEVRNAITLILEAIIRIPCEIYSKLFFVNIFIIFKWFSLIEEKNAVVHFSGFDTNRMLPISCFFSRFVQKPHIQTFLHVFRFARISIVVNWTYRTCHI